MNSVLLPTSYLPPINYFSQVLNNESVFIEQHEHFIKQTYRNRCDILSSNGKLSLSIPLQNNGDKEIISEKKISWSCKLAFSIDFVNSITIASFLKLSA